MAGRTKASRRTSRARRRVPGSAGRGRRRATARSKGQSAGNAPSATALAAEALRTGVLPAHQSRRSTLPKEDEMIRVGDPDDDSLANEYVGDETPGGSSPTPDQSDVDEIGRVYGLQEEDAGDLHAAGEILGRRDHHRAELRPPKKRRY